ncbi:unnamed protein product [Amoebophrya sp. A120]|nr:unnamed protein product [Amoebophrya sp. A120]|eukprot:GSA120T00011112001.1
MLGFVRLVFVFSCAGGTVTPSNLRMLVQGLSITSGKPSNDSLTKSSGGTGESGSLAHHQKITFRYTAPYKGNAGNTHYDYLQRQIECRGDGSVEDSHSDFCTTDDDTDRFLLFTDASVRRSSTSTRPRNIGATSSTTPTFAQLGIVAYNTRGLAEARKITEEKAASEVIDSLYDRVPDILAAGLGQIRFKEAQKLLRTPARRGVGKEPSTEDERAFLFYSDSWKDNALTAVAEGEALLQGLNLVHNELQRMKAESSEVEGRAPASERAKLLASTDSLDLVLALEWIFHGELPALADVVDGGGPGAGLARHMQNTVAQPMADLFSRVGLTAAFRTTLAKLAAGDHTKFSVPHVEILQVRSSSRVIRKKQAGHAAFGTTSSSDEPVSDEEVVPSEATTSLKAYTFGNALADQLASGFTLMNQIGAAPVDLLSKQFCENPGGWLKSTRWTSPSSSAAPAEQASASRKPSTAAGAAGAAPVPPKDEFANKKADAPQLYVSCKAMFQDLKTRLSSVLTPARDAVAGIQPRGPSQTSELEQELLTRFAKFAHLYQRHKYAASARTSSPQVAPSSGDVVLAAAKADASPSAFHTGTRGRPASARRGRKRSSSSSRRRPKSTSRSPSQKISSRSASRSSSRTQQDQSAGSDGATEDGSEKSHDVVNDKKQKEPWMTPLDWFRSQAQVALQHCGSPRGLEFASKKLTDYLNVATATGVEAHEQERSVGAGGRRVSPANVEEAPASAFDFSAYQEGCAKSFREHFGNVNKSSAPSPSAGIHALGQSWLPPEGGELLGRLWARIAVVRRVRSSLAQSQSVLRAFLASISPSDAKEAGAGPSSPAPAVAAAGKQKKKKKKQAGPADELSYLGVVLGTVTAAQFVFNEMSTWAPTFIEKDLNIRTAIDDTWAKGPRPQLGGRKQSQTRAGTGAQTSQDASYIWYARMMKQPMQVLGNLLTTFTAPLHANNAGIRLATRGNYRATAERVLDELTKAAIPLATDLLDSLLTSLENWVATVILPLSTETSQGMGKNKCTHACNSARDALKSEAAFFSKNLANEPIAGSIDWRKNGFERRLLEMHVVAAAVEKEKQTLLLKNLHKIPKVFLKHQGSTASICRGSDVFRATASYVKNLQQARDVYIPAHELVLSIDLQYAGIDFRGTTPEAKRRSTSPAFLAPPPLLSLADLPVSLMQQLSLEPTTFAANVEARLSAAACTRGGAGQDSSCQDEEVEDAVLYRGRFGLGRLRMRDAEGKREQYLDVVEKRTQPRPDWPEERRLDRLWLASPWARSNWTRRQHEMNPMPGVAAGTGPSAPATIDMIGGAASTIEQIFRRSSGPSVASVVAESLGLELPIRLSGLVEDQDLQDAPSKGERAVKMVMRNAEGLSDTIAQKLQYEENTNTAILTDLRRTRLADQCRTAELFDWLFLKIQRSDGDRANICIIELGQRGIVQTLEHRDEEARMIRKDQERGCDKLWLGIYYFFFQDDNSRLLLLENASRIRKLMPQSLPYGSRKKAEDFGGGGSTLSFSDGGALAVRPNTDFEEIFPFEAPPGGAFVEYHPTLQLPVAYTTVADFQSGPMENKAPEGTTRTTVAILFYDEGAAKFAVLPISSSSAGAAQEELLHPHLAETMPRAPLQSYDAGLRWALQPRQLQEVQLVSPKYLHGTSVRGIVDSPDADLFRLPFAQTKRKAAGALPIMDEARCVSREDFFRVPAFLPGERDPFSSRETT